MEVAVSAARWVVNKALAPVTDGLLEAWAASAGLGPNIDALKMQLLYAQGMLNNAQGLGRDITNPALKGLLHKLRQLAYVADDALDELDYFRIQDELEGTYHAAANVDDRGCLQGLALNARHTARAVAGKIKSMCSCSRAASPSDDQEDIGGSRGCSCVGRCSMPKVASGAVQAAVGKHFPCCYSSPNTSELAESSNMPAASGWRLLCGACPPKAPAQRVRTIEETPKLKFDRVEMSKRMIEIVEQLKHVCAMVSTILNLELLSLSRIPTQVGVAMDRSKTTQQIIEPKLYGRATQKKEIIDGITHGEYSSKQLTVLPIVGPGGVGKTTFTQHIFEEVKSCFQVTIWICVSLNFSADRLAQEILEQIPTDNSSENKKGSKEEQIEQRLRSKRFLLVLDDVWKYHDDEWKKLLAPFRKVVTEGNMVIVTTRIPGVATMVRTVDHSIEMERLGPQDIMSFFEACVFGDKQQPWQGHPELYDVGHKIVENLKGSPLAAKTVGRLLRNQLTQDHWTRVLESKEWESQVSDDDIMPALKLSYDYLPFHLQQCLSCCALFPEDYEFHAEELVHLWIGLGILHSDGRKRRIEDVGLCYLTDLVNQGFFKENVSRFGSPYYTIHDLLLELVVKVSSYECLSICSSNVMSVQIPPSVRHLSIIVDDADVKNKVTFEDYKRCLYALEERFEVQNIHTLMLFGEYHANFSRVFRGLFLEARALRTVFLSGAPYNVEDVLPNFSKLVHLRYLRIKSAGFLRHDKGLCVPSVLCRFYHLEVIDLQGWKGRFGSTRHISNLVKLRHFVVPREKLHSDIFEVGKLKFINELRAFRVGQESKVFDLSQLGKLANIGGLLGIYNLEKVQSEEEATESKLIQKNHMKELILEWDVQRSNRDPKFEENILESLVPHSNLQCLRIRGHGGTNCPRWLGANLSITNLESLSLLDLSWGNLPALGMWMVNDLGVEYQDCILDQRFQNLKRLELVKIPRLRKWVEDNTSHLFPQLEALTIKDCSELTELRFSYHSSSGMPQQEKSMGLFPRLKYLRIEDCPKLLSLPPIPWTSGPCSAVIERVGSGLEKLILYEENGSGSTCSLEVEGKHGEDCVFLDELVFSNLTYLRKLVMKNCSPLLLSCLLLLTSLEFLVISDSSNVLSPVESVSHAQCLLPVKKISVEGCGCNGKELTELFSLMTELTKIEIKSCQGINWLGVARQSSASSSSAAAEQLHHGQIGQQQQELKGGVDGVLLLPPQLQKLNIKEFPELSLLSYSLEGDREGGGLQGLHSLQSLKIRDCPKLLHSYSSSSFPFPTSLQKLLLRDCGEFRGEGIGPLLAQGHLTELYIFKTPKFFAGSEPLDKELLPCSSAHQELELTTDDIAGFLAAHSCSLLSSSLTTLSIGWDKDAERFTHEQAEALQLLTSLQTLEFWCCEKLQCLPAGLHRLASLETLRIQSCQVIRSLPEDGLPSSLKKLEIRSCPAIKSLPKGSLPSSLQLLIIHGFPALTSLPKNGLPSSLQKLEIWFCPALKSLPEDGLPRSLQVLDVSYCHNEELKRQCRKLRGTIPKIITA